MSLLSAADWQEFLARFPEAHLLQTPQWGQLKSAFGWQPLRIATDQAGAQILFRRLPLGFTFAYLPKGPVGEHWEELWPRIDRLCRQQRAVFLKVEPDLWETADGETKGVLPPSFSPSPHTIQPPRTLIVDLRGEEDVLLARMKQKTRYNIRLAIRRGVIVRPSSDLDTFNRLMQVTAQRDAFGIHSPDYYRQAYDLFHPHGLCELFIAEFEHQPLAAIMVFAHGERAWYFYGASSDLHRNLMPTYLLQWKAMLWAKSRGCSEYDLWGVPDAPLESLEADFKTRSDGLWGVYRFKRGFGGELRRAVGAWDRVYRPLLYFFYRWWTSSTARQ